MKQNERLLWAGGIVLLDILVFAVPVAAFFAAFVLLARPAWFRDWMNKVYESPV